ncbi:MAG: HD-GYP domain-containing protein [Brevinematales bacterium]|nr:HD-GYP domain-containing protein [Brevinematales bacterium]
MEAFDKKEVIPVSYLKEGIILNGNIYDMSGGFLWPAKVPIKREFIETLYNLGIKELTYRPITTDVSFSKQNVENPILSDSTQKKVYESFHSVVWDITNSKIPKTEKAKESVEEAAKEIKFGMGKTLNLLDLKGHDTYSYIHAVNTSILSTYIASRLGLSMEKTIAVGLGALLIDIGKIKIPVSILNKKDPLTPFEFDTIKKHPTIGYQLIKESPYLDEISKRIVLLHHEQVDGKGYPLGVDGSKIDIYAKIVSICDSFDAMTTERPYRSPLPIRVAIEEILKGTGTKYDYEIAIKFAIEMSKMYKIQTPLSEGSTVELTSGELAIIKKLHSDYDMLPEVLILIGSNRSPLRVPLSVDLTKDATGRKIKRVIFDIATIMYVKSVYKTSS